MTVFTCPYCKEDLKEVNGYLKCLNCDLTFPIVKNIPDFLQKNPEPERKKMIKAIDRLSTIYETPLWYPLIYHFYGGFFIPSIKETVNSITDMLEIDGGIALDVACGTGLYTRSIAQRAKEVYGIDFSMEMLKKAQEYAKKENLDNIIFARAEVEHLPFKNKFFDGISCYGALHLFPDVTEALGEMNRVLKKDHKLAVMTFVKKRFLGIKRIYEHLNKDHHFHVFDVDELKVYLENTGYSDFKYNIYGSMILFEAKKI